MTDWCQDNQTQSSCPAEGCRHCCIGKREHAQFWCPGVGYHGYTEPTREQMHQRMWVMRLAKVRARVLRDPVWRQD